MPVGKVAHSAPTRGGGCAYNKGTFNTRHMETLDLATLELLAAFEADLDVDLDAIDADEMLDDEA
jgi:hypothetical protein